MGLALHFPLFFLAEQIGIALEHRSSLVAGDFYAFLLVLIVGLPQFAGAASTEVVEQPSGVLGSFTMIPAVRAVALRIQHREVIALGVPAIAAVVAAQAIDDACRLPAFPIVTDWVPAVVKDQFALGDASSSPACDDLF